MLHMVPTQTDTSLLFAALMTGSVGKVGFKYFFVSHLKTALIKLKANTETLNI